MAATKSTVSPMMRKFDRAIARLEEQEAGKKFKDVDRPMDIFIKLYSEIVSRPIENSDQAEILHKLVAYFMKEGRDEGIPFAKGPYEGSVDDAIYAVLSDAIGDATTPFDTAILALARFRLQEMRKPSPNA